MTITENDIITNAAAIAALINGAPASDVTIADLDTVSALGTNNYTHLAIDSVDKKAVIETSLTDDDTKIPTSGSIVDYIYDNINNYIQNILINGGYTISQRGNYASSPVAIADATYYLDRWKTNLTGVGATIQQLTDLPSGNYGTNSVKLIATSSVTGQMGISQIVEKYDYYKGQTVTFAAWVKSNKSTSILLQIYDGVSYTYSDQHTGGGDWELLTVTKTISSSATQLRLYASLAGGGIGYTSITSGDYIQVAMCSANIGSIALPFLLRHNELQLCQRYNFRLSGDGRTIAVGCYLDSTTSYFVIPLPVTMRIAPTLSYNAVSDLTIFTNNTSTVSTAIAGNAGQILNTMYEVAVTTAAMIQGYASFARINGASAYLNFDAEL